VTADDLDRALRGDDSIAPSSGFAAAVRAAVMDAAAEPPPLPFPWGRLALGMVAGLGAAAAGAWLAARVAGPLAQALPLEPLQPVLQPVGYAVLALLLSLALMRLPRLWTRRF
jgi:hypothetical protein